MQKRKSLTMRRLTGRSTSWLADCQLETSFEILLVSVSRNLSFCLGVVVGAGGGGVVAMAR